MTLRKDLYMDTAILGGSVPTPQQHWNFYFSSRFFYTEIQTRLSDKENFNMKFNEIGNLKLKVKFNN